MTIDTLKKPLEFENFLNYLKNLKFLEFFKFDLNFLKTLRFKHLCAVLLNSPRFATHYYAPKARFAKQHRTLNFRPKRKSASTATLKGIALKFFV